MTAASKRFPTCQRLQHLSGPQGQVPRPSAGANDPGKALYRLTQVPALRAKFLAYVDVAEKWLDWKVLGPLAEQYQSVIAEEIKLDNRKVDTTENFTKRVTVDREESAGGGFGGRGGRGFNEAPRLSLKSFAEQRRAYLLAYK